MNVIAGEITSIRVNGSLSQVEVKTGKILLKTIVIETPKTAGYLKEGNEIKVIFKETEVIIGKGAEHAISLQNRLPGNISSIENGALLCKLTISTSVGNIIAIITSDAANQLQLKTNDNIIAMIKTNEIMLSE